MRHDRGQRPADVSVMVADDIRDERVGAPVGKAGRSCALALTRLIHRDQHIPGIQLAIPAGFAERAAPAAAEIDATTLTYSGRAKGLSHDRARLSLLLRSFRLLNATPAYFHRA